MHFSFSERYTIIRPLGVGGMAELYLAERSGARGARRRVVLKRMLQAHAADAELKDLFIHEARIAMQLSHTNIVQVYDFEERPDGFVLEMELVDGCDLRRVLSAGGPLPAGAAIFIASQVLKALDYVHRRCGPDGLPLELVHRDVTPGNILLSREGEVKLTDFGLARSRDRGLSQGGIKGTFAFMAPEQAEGGHLDSRTDLFAVGVCLYAMLSGKSPFEADGPVATLDRVRSARFEPLTSVSAELAAVVHRALEHDPARRFETAAVFREQLEAAGAGLKLDETGLSARIESAAGPRAPAGDAATELQIAAPPPGAPAAIDSEASGPVDVRPKTVRAARGAGRKGQGPLVVAVAVPLVAGLGFAAWVVRVPSPDAPVSPPAPAVVVPAPTPASPAPPEAAPSPVAPQRKALLTISADPWAHVRVDGRSVGTTPVRALPLSAGAHEVVLENPALGVSKSRVVKLKAGEERTIVESLGKSPSPP